jgi:ribosome-associated protein
MRARPSPTMTELTHDASDTPTEERGPSRSQGKRDARAVSALGERLAAVGAGLLERLPLDEELRDAVRAVRDLQRGARMRQRRLVGKLLRARDHEAIAAALAAVGQPSGAEIVRDQRADAWRARLLTGGDAELSALLTEHPGADRQQLRQLIRQGREEPPGARSLRARRELFRLLRSLFGDRSEGS